MKALRTSIEGDHKRPVALAEIVGVLVFLSMIFCVPERFHIALFGSFGFAICTIIFLVLHAGSCVFVLFYKDIFRERIKESNSNQVYLSFLQAGFVVVLVGAFAKFDAVFLTVAANSIEETRRTIYMLLQFLHQ